MSADIVDTGGAQERDPLCAMEDHLRELGGLLQALWLMAEGMAAAGGDKADSDAVASVVDAAQKHRDRLKELWNDVRRKGGTE